MFYVLVDIAPLPSDFITVQYVRHPIEKFPTSNNCLLCDFKDEMLMAAHGPELLVEDERFKMLNR